MRKHILLLFLTLSFGVFSQKISNSDFENTDWFAGINGEDLFKSDTLIISKLTTLEPKKFSHMWMFVEMDYLKTDLFSTLEFRNNEIFIEEVDTEWCGFNFSDQINWQFDNETKNLRLYKNGNLIAEYKVISQTTDFTEWSNKAEKKPIELSANIVTLELIKLKNN